MIDVSFIARAASSLWIKTHPKAGSVYFSSGPGRFPQAVGSTKGDRSLGPCHVVLRGGISSLIGA